MSAADAGGGEEGGPTRARLAAETARWVGVLNSCQAPLLIDGLADPALYAWLDTEPPDLASLTRRFEAVCQPAPRGELWLNWALRLRGEKRYWGVAEATVHPNRDVDLAYFVFTPDQGRGYAVEACAEVIDRLAHKQGAGPFRIDVDTRNVASQRVAAKLGFIRAPEPVLAGTLRGEPQWDYRFTLRLPR